MAHFKLSSSDKEFNNRVDGLFSSLDEVSTTLPDGGFVFDSTSSGKRSHLDSICEDSKALPSSGFRSKKMLDVKSGTFKAANDVGCGDFVTPTHRNIPNKRFKSKNTPGFMKSPDNWTQYSMKDTEVMDDAQNKSAALQLLSDLRDKKNEEEQESNEDPNPGKIVFRKPTTNKAMVREDLMDLGDDEMDTDHSGDFGGTKKIMMPEYVVGSKKSKNKKPKQLLDGATSNKKSKELKLSYLSFEDDEAE